MLKLKFRNLGPIKAGEIELGKKLTLLCGENSIGKTYASYSIYGLLHNIFDLNADFMKTHIREIRENGIYAFDLQGFLEKDFDRVIQEIGNTYSKLLPVIFSTKKDFFAETDIKLIFDKEPIFQNVKRKKSEADLMGVGNIQKQADTYSVVITLFEKQQILPEKLFNEFVCRQILKIIFFHDLVTDVFLLPSERAGIHLFFRELSANRNLAIEDIAEDPSNIS